MSGGHFDYIQYRMEDIAAEIDRIIDENDNMEENKWGNKMGCHYPSCIIERFREAAHTIRQAQDMAQRVDWLLSGDDNGRAFLARWNEEVRKSF